MSGNSDELHDHYGRGLERDRLTTPLGTIEYERTVEILGKFLPSPPAVVADIGGGPGRYAVWLAEAGYTVIHRDVVRLHVDQLREEAAGRNLAVDSAVADARDLDVDDRSVDAVLLLGPLYHLPLRTDRLRALREVRRILRAGGVAFLAAISRWAPRLHGEVVQRLYEDIPGIREETPRVERTGRLAPLFPGSFAGFCHRPRQLRGEIVDAGLEPLDVVAVEGIAFALPDLEERLATPEGRAVVMDAARALERVPELVGLGPHLLATARHPG
jgi:SAM-dependent methyltransferase